jgi:hypothetical protein
MMSHKIYKEAEKKRKEEKRPFGTIALAMSSGRKLKI